MVKASKLFARLVSGRASMRFRDFQRVLEAFGFELDRVSGSHHIYKHARVPRVLNVQRRGDEANPYQIDEFLDMIQQYGLTMDE